MSLSASIAHHNDAPTEQAAPSSTQLRELAEAARMGRSLRRATRVALFNAWVIGAFAALTLVTSVHDRPSLLLGFAMTVCAYVEFSGAVNLRRLSSTALPRLCVNQLCLGAALIAYAVWK
ncbi:MAG: hypothetical protein ACREJC_07030, partial [Tepidisphaeraceae bacterium]